MLLTRRSFVAAVACSMAVLFPIFAAGQSPQVTPGVTAIDILLAPDEVMMGHARAVNERLRTDFKQGFALDALHAPHVTLLQRFVRTSELDKVHAAVAKVLLGENPTVWELRATGYYDIPIEKLGLAGIVIEPTPDLLRLQQKLIDAVAPFTAETATGEAFALRPDGKTIAQAQPTIDYVATFVPKMTGKNYNPHVTIGLGTREFVDKLKAEPFQSFKFKARAVDVYQLGEFGTAQKLLWSSAPADPLPSWNEGPAKKAILEFVVRTTKAGSPDFLPVAERIATFDNDGTLWCEQPIPVQLAFALVRVHALADKHPEWKTQEPFKSALAGDFHGLAATGEKGLVELVMATHAGMTTDEFAEIGRNWLATAKHPKFGHLYTECVYQPMLELLAYLRANGFKTFIVSGGGIELMRLFAEKVYGIPPEQVIGSSIVTKFEVRDKKPVLVREPRIDFIDDKVGKPVAINKFIGRRPVMAFGNSDGDFQMLEWTTAGTGPRLGMLVHHTDAEREYAYDRKAGMAKLDRGLDEARARGWVVASMKTDFKRVFAFEK